VITFVKDKGNNLSIVVVALLSIIDCEPFKFLWVYEGTCFGHVMSKVCQYVMNDDKVLMSLTLASVKDAQTSLQKVITWTKKSRKGRHEWEKACINSGMRPWKLKTLVKTKFNCK